MDLNFDLDLDFFKTLITDFDLMALLPEMADVMEWIVTGVIYALIIGPCLLILLGLWYLLLPSREANHFVGYRFFWGMGSIKSWRFTQRLAGAAWVGLGAYLATLANELRVELLEMNKLDMMYKAIEMILKQISWLVAVCLVVNAVVFLIFNFKGKPRWLWRWIGKSIKNLFTRKPKKQETPAEAPVEAAPEVTTEAAPEVVAEGNPEVAPETPAETPAPRRRRRANSENQ